MFYEVINFFSITKLTKCKTKLFGESEGKIYHDPFDGVHHSNHNAKMIQMIETSNW